MRSEREAAIEAFLADAGWGGARREALAGDASTRRYERLTRDGGSAVLMDAPPAAETPACPPDAGPEQRARLGYNAEARLAGPDVAAFAGLAAHLRGLGLSAPEIVSADLDAGLLLLEDLGDAVFARRMAASEDERRLYAAAVETLAALHDAAPPERVSFEGRNWPLLAYDDVAALAETELLLDWYLPHRGTGIGERARGEWRSVWRDAVLAAGTGDVLTLRDYHAENLLWLPRREGGARVGLLDFQDALIGHAAYDLVSLAEDARRDVAAPAQADIVARYLAEAAPADRAGFEAGYAVWGAQRNAKILGIFVRLAKRDGKTRYLDLLPRVEAYFRGDLAHDALAPVGGWLRRHAPELAR